MKHYECCCICVEWCWTYVRTMFEWCWNDDVHIFMSKMLSKWVPKFKFKPKIKFEPNFKFAMLFGCCNAFQTMLILFVLTMSSIRALLRSKLTFMKNVLKKSSKGRVNGLISKQGFFRPCLNQPNKIPTHLFYIIRLCAQVFHFFEFVMVIWIWKSCYPEFCKYLDHPDM